MKRTALEKWICQREGFRNLTRAELEALQLRRLNELLRRERERGGFYAGLPEKLDSLAELECLPFTTATQLEDRGSAMLLTSQAEISRVVTDRTSGTTGSAKRVFYSEGDCENTVGFFAAGISEMAGFGDRVAVIMPFSGGNGLGELIARAVKKLGAEPLRWGIGHSFGELCSLLNAERPQACIGMPVPLLSLLRFRGSALPLRRALVSGDACPRGVAEALENMLASRLFPHYGSREMCMGGAVTCQAHEGMHLRENHIIAEIIDSDGHVLPDGSTGELVVTTIGMEAMPLIRYRTGDMARILPGPCPCGGITRRLDSVFRRAPETLDITVLDDILFRLPGLVDYAPVLENDTLFIDAFGTASPRELSSAVSSVYPNRRTEVHVSEIHPSDTPRFLGKRHIHLKRT